MIEQINIQHKKTLFGSVLLALFGMSFWAMILLFRRKVSLRNSNTGAVFWGILFLLEGVVLAIWGGRSEELESLIYWVLFIFLMFPLIMTGIGLIGGLGQQDAYLKDVDKLLNCLIQGEVFSLDELEEIIPKNNYIESLNDHHIIHIMKDLAACDVLSFQQIGDKISVNFLLPAFKTLRPELSLTCPNCGAGVSGHIDAQRMYICEYCGTSLKE